MKKTMLVLLTLMVLFTAFVTVSCGNEEVVEELVVGTTFEGMVDVPYTDWAIGEKGGTFVRCTFGSDAKTFNSIVAEETSSTDVLLRLSTPLVRRNQMNLEWEPALAESWTVSEDQKTLTLKLRKNLKWSDGEPITADDFVWPVENIYFAEGIEGSNKDGLSVDGDPSIWKKIDDLTLSITVPVVYAGLMTMANTSPLPVHIFKPVLEEGGPEAINAFWGVDSDISTIVSSGPFLIDKYVAAEKITFKPNPNYYEKDAKGNQLPYIEELIYVYVEDEDTILAKWLADELDFYSLRGEDYAILIGEKEAHDFELFNVGPAFGTNFITFNQNPIEGEGDAGIEGPKLEWLSNKKFRHAMGYIIDRQNIVDNVYYGFGFPQYTFVPRQSPYYWEGADDVAMTFDPEKAKALLDEIGYKDTDNDGFREDANGNKITLNLSTNSGNKTREAIGTLFAEEARKIGIEVNFTPVDFNTLVTQLVSSYDWDMILIGLTGSVDPISGANSHRSSGSLHMIEPNQESPRRDWEAEVDRLWALANNTMSEDQRAENYLELQKIWMEEMPWVYTFSPVVMYAYKNKWGNVKPQSVSKYQWDSILHRIYVKDTE